DFQLRWNDMVPQANSTRQMRELIASLQAPEGSPLVDDTFFALGAPVAITVTLAEEGEQHVNPTIDLIRETAQQVGIPPEELHMGGSPVGRAALNSSTETP